MRRTVSRARIYADDKIVIVRTSYDPEFVELLKEEVPKHARYWNPDEKVWEIYPDYLEAVEELCKQFFDDVEVEEIEEYEPREEPRQRRDKDKKEETKSGQSDGDPWLMLKPFLTKDVIKDIYRIFAKKYHPDVGGDGKKMTEINNLFDKLAGR